MLRHRKTRSSHSPGNLKMPLRLKQDVQCSPILRIKLLPDPVEDTFAHSLSLLKGKRFDGYSLNPRSALEAHKGLRGLSPSERVPGTGSRL
jgi:hypothetical protein